MSLSKQALARRITVLPRRPQIVERMDELDDLVDPLIQRWAQRCVHDIGRRVPPQKRLSRRGLVIVHLDGVPRNLLEEAIRSGEMPFLHRLVESGTYQMSGAFWGSPASTPAFQAGLLYGLRHPNLPAYHWYDRELGRSIHMDVPADALEIESRLSKHDESSLLAGGGTSYLSLFQAGASNRVCMSALSDLPALAKTVAGDLRDARLLLRHGISSLARALVSETAQNASEILNWCSRLGDSRHERDFLVNYLLLVSLAWRYAHARAMIDVIRGVPAVYLVFGNFDEVAHRRGPQSMRAKKELLRVDFALEELYAIAQAAPTPYDVYFLTDHGHVESAPFEKCRGRRIQDYLFNGPPARLSEELKRGLVNGHSHQPLDKVPMAPMVVDAGDFAHVYLQGAKRPMEAAAVASKHPNILGHAVSAEEIGVVAMRRGDSAVAVIDGMPFGPSDLGTANLPSGYSRRAVRDLLEELPNMPNAGDLVLFGGAHQNGTVSFSWEFGSHGGLMSAETESFICWPSDRNIDLSSLSHATQLHEKLAGLYRN